MYKHKIFLILFAFSIFASSCNKDLELFPTDTFTEDKAYLSVDDLQRGLNTAYARFSPESRIIPNSTTSDEIKFGVDNAGANQFEYRLQYNADNTTGGATLTAWGSQYSVIDQINRVLEVIPNVPNALPTDAARKDVIRGQLLALRGLCHFYLLNAYSKRYDAADPLGVPYMTVSNLVGTPARNTVAQTIAGIEGDFTTARALLAAPSASAFDDRFINQITVDGFRARVALYKRDWPNARDIAGTVISSAVRPLVSGTAFANIWTDANTTGEVLFRLRRGGQSVGASYTTSGGQVNLSPSDKLTALFAVGDVRTTSFIGTLSGKRIVNKFFTSAAGVRVNDMKEMRIAEMHLIRAEARAELNDLAGATADINLLRSNRITGYTNVADFANQATAINEILTERFKELCFEGFRFFDLKRRGLDLNRLASDVDSPLWLTMPASNFRWQYPIPAAEILANPNMVQNANY